MSSHGALVKDADIKQLAGFHDLVSEADIFWGRGRVARRVVVGDNNRCRRRFNGRTEDLSDSHHAAVEAAFVDGADIQHPVAGVQQGDMEFFLLEIS
jgi:hypothetical protein